jgi:hypothetical protein
LPLVVNGSNSRETHTKGYRKNIFKKLTTSGLPFSKAGINWYNNFKTEIYEIGKT